jgi:hypothetical protein
MAKMVIEESHRLPIDKAVQKIKDLLTQTQQRFVNQISGLQQSWTKDRATFSFTASGISVKGTIVVTSNQVVLEGELPWMVKVAVGGKIESVIHEEARKLLKA